MNKEIADLNEQISKSTNEIAKEFELKYRDYVPSFIGLAVVQEKIQNTIKDGNERLKKVETILTAVENAGEKAKEEQDSLHRKQHVINDFLNRLKILNEMENSLGQLWVPSAKMPAQDSDAPKNNDLFDPLALVRVILQLEDQCKTLESESENNLEAINERILPLLFMEIKTRRGELYHQLDDFYRNFLRFSDNDRTSPPMAVMSIAVQDVRITSDCLTAMNRLGMFEQLLDEFVDAFWEQFCLKLIYADPQMEETEHFFQVDDKFTFERTMSFEIRKEVKSSKKPIPANVFKSLTKLFDGLGKALNGVRVEDQMLVDIFGDCISERLLSTLEKGCLNPAIPFEKEKAKIVHTELTQLTQNFLQFMKDQGFFTQPVSNMLESIFNNFDRISIDRRCLHYITTSRDMIKQPYIDLVEVGFAMDEKEERKAEIMVKVQDKTRINAEDSNLSTSLKWDKYHPNLFQFKRCKIAQSTFELLNMVQEVLRAAGEADSEMEACRLVTTARNIVQMFINLTPDCHKVVLKSVPQIAAIFFNNCHYIRNRLMTLPVDVIQNVMKVSKLTQQNCAFTDMLSQLSTLAADTLEMHVVNVRRQLSASIGDKDIFCELRVEKLHEQCKKRLQACVMQIDQISNVWKEVMSPYILAQSLGSIVSYLLSILVNFILRKEDITSAEITAYLLEDMVKQLEGIMTIDEKPMIQKLCEQPYYQLQEIIFCLKGSLSEIDNRWCEGKGPLATWLKATQVKQLIRAIFQNTDRRAQLLAQIN